MTEHDSILRIVQDFHSKIDAGFRDLREHIDERADKLQGGIDGTNTRIGTVEQKQRDQDSTMKGAWKVLTAIAVTIGTVIGWAISFFK